MFEQSTVPSGQPSKRFWATCLGITGQAILVGCAILAPMVFPQVLPRTALVTSLLPPVPPGRPKPDPERPHTKQPRTAPTKEYRSGAFFQPVSYPKTAATIIDPPPEEFTGGPGVVGAPEAFGNGGAGALMDRILGSASAPPPRPVVTGVVRTPEPPATPAAPVRVRQGGRVQPAAVLKRVEPIYPPLAKQMRVAGTVELQGVIGVDGQIRELKVMNGHPLLARAALDAVSQWVYAPTRLNGDLVEVITTISITFHLN
jgi:protein TonB